MLWDVTEKGLQPFNEIVGVDHVMRPFRMERVSLPAKRDPLLAGLSNRDVALEGTEKIYPWAGDRYPANDTFTNIVDLDDIAPFGKSAKTAFGWSQMTNGLTTADSWKFIYYHNLKEQGDKPIWEAEFPKEAEITRFSIMINTDYNRINKIRLIFDDNPKNSVTLDLKTDPQLRQDFDISPRRFKKIAVQPLAWRELSKTPVIGVDKIWITVNHDEDYRNKVVPLLNIGGLVRYKFGKGAIILNQLRIQAAEPNPVNAEKKQSIMSTLLRNMGAAFAAEKTLIAGANMNYRPIPLGDKCNQYLTGERGWIDGQPNMGQFPVGDQKLAGVAYAIRDFKTSPLPSCIMLAGPGMKGELAKSVSGIPVDEKADALFFLHTFHRVKDWRAEGDKKEPPPVFVYVVKFADGKSVEIPVRYERGVGPWITAQPSGVAEAAVAWNAPLPKDPSKQMAVYQMMWKNPRPGETIKSIDVKFDDKVGNAYGVPIVLGITAAKAE
jgi:beta-galactosidase